MRRRLRLVSSHDPADIFNDLERLQREQRGELPSQRRAKATETFARFPHDKALALCKHRLSSSAWIVLVELDRLILKRRGQNPVRFDSGRLNKIGLKASRRAYALRQLASAGVVRVAPRGSGLSPWVTHLWYPLTD